MQAGSKVVLSELLFVESMENYVQLYTKERRLTTLLPLKNLMEELPTPPFLPRSPFLPG